MSDMGPRSGRDDDVLSSSNSTSGGASAVSADDLTRGDNADFDYTGDSSSGVSTSDAGTFSTSATGSGDAYGMAASGASDGSAAAPADTSYGTDSIGSSDDRAYSSDPSEQFGRQGASGNQGGGTNNPGYDGTGLGMSDAVVADNDALGREGGGNQAPSVYGTGDDTGVGPAATAADFSDARGEDDVRDSGLGDTLRPDDGVGRSDGASFDDTVGAGDSGSAIADLLNDPGAGDDSTLRGDFDQTNGVLDAFEDRGDGTRATELDTGASDRGL